MILCWKLLYEFEYFMWMFGFLIVENVVKGLNLLDGDYKKKGKGESKVICDGDGSEENDSVERVWVNIIYCIVYNVFVFEWRKGNFSLFFINVKFLKIDLDKGIVFNGKFVDYLKLLKI